MSKYEPLWEYISKTDAHTLSFEEIKNILGFDIDHSFLTYKKDLQSHGYKVNKISMKEKFILITKL